MPGRIKFILIFIFLVFTAISPVQGQISDAAIINLIDRINEVEKVDQLYTIRFNIGRYAARKDLTIRQQELLSKAMKELSYAFSIRSHFRNAADVYRDYLEFNESYLTRYNAFVKDSLDAVHKKVVIREQSEISSLENRITELKQRKEAVTGLKQKYYTLGGIAAVAIIVITIMIAMAKSRSIKLTEAHIASNQEKLLQSNRAVTQTHMLMGSIGYCMQAAASNTEIVNTIVSSVEQSDDAKLFQKEINALKKAGEVFAVIKS